MIARRLPAVVVGVAVIGLAFMAGYYFGRPSADELAGLPPNMKAPPGTILGGWEQRGVEAPAAVEFFRDWTYWYWNKQIMGRRIMGSFTLDGDTVILRPRFFTRYSIDDVSPLSMELSGSDASKILRSDDGKIFEKIRN